MLSALQHFSLRSITILVDFLFTHLLQGIVYSLISPFYPREAMSKGASATEYSLVFGIYELVIFLVSGLIGKHLGLLGARNTLLCGIALTGVMVTLFGQLDLINARTPFIVLSLMLRSVEAFGAAAYFTAFTAILMVEFDKTIFSTIFALAQSFLGFGLILGPMVGQLLYNLRGFQLPFTVVGLICFTNAIVTSFILPSTTGSSKDLEDEDEARTKATSRQVFFTPTVGLAIFSNFCNASLVSFFMVTLERRASEMKLPDYWASLSFTILGAVFGLMAPLVGLIVDRLISDKIMAIIGYICVLVIEIVILMVPSDSLSLLLINLVLAGIGIGIINVTAVVTSRKEAILHGFADNLDTYGVVSGLLSASFALGAFSSPVINGIIVDQVGIRISTTYLVVLFAILLVISIVFYCHKRRMEAIETKEDLVRPLGQESQTSYGTETRNDET